MEAKKEGKSVLLSSHILSEVEKLCDKVSIIRQGKIIETGSLEELRHLTRNRMNVQTAKPLQNLGELKGVHDLEQKDNSVSFQVDTEELDNVIKHLSSFGILKLESAPPTLEDLFMRHYHRDGGEV